MPEARADLSSVVTPPPANGFPPPPLGAEPETPFGVPPPLDLHDQAALLAAEAAAVRALDSGPITPPPVIDDPGPTPPPVLSNLRGAFQRSGVLPGPPTPPPQTSTPLDFGATPSVEVGPEPPPLDQGLPTPPPVHQQAAAPATPPPVERTATPPPLTLAVTTAAAPAATPPPVERTATPPPVIAAAPTASLPEVGADGPATPPPAVAESADAPAAPGPSSIDDGVGLPSSAAADGLALKAEAAQQVAAADSSPATDDDGVVATDDDLEVMEGVDGVPGDHVAVPPPISGIVVAPAPTAQSRPVPPPPIPGSHQLKTPRPELRAPDGDPAAPASPSLAGLPILPEALAQRPRRPKRSKPWFEEVFDEDYLRTLPFMRVEQTLREVEFIEASLKLPVGAEVLDVGCGYGRHAIELVHRGLNVTGLDLSLPLLIRAADEAQRRSVSVNFVHADMREMAFENQFDGAYSMLTSFGYFDEEANLRVAEGIARALKPGARLLLDVVNRDYVVPDLPSRVWWEGNGCVVLEEVDFNFHTSRIVTHRSIVFEDGRQVEQEISIRAYSLHELGRLLRQAGLRVIDVSGTLATPGQFFGSTSRSLLVLAEKRVDET
jgi:SAM-dependent methyltransferase